jgi:hypothetical protein
MKKGANGHKICVRINAVFVIFNKQKSIINKKIEEIIN